MKILAAFDADNYQDTTEVFEKYSVRAIILRDGKMATQCGYDGEFKIPGGGLEPGEDFYQALVREVREETGLHVITESIQELGEIVEIRKDLFKESQKYICHSLFYYCEVDAEQEPLHLTQSEIAKGYVMKWEKPSVIYQRNIENKTDPWIIRDTEFVRMLAEGEIALPEHKE